MAFRKMLLNTFGLHTIFNYPAIDLFESVVEETCIFVGKARIIQDAVSVFSSSEKVADIDLHALESFNGRLSDNFEAIIPGVEGCRLERAVLMQSLEDGWRMVCSEMIDSIDFVSSKIFSNAKMITVENSGLRCTRGKVGANGGSDLVFFDSLPQLYNKHHDLVTRDGLRNAQLDSFELNSGDSKFLDFNGLSDSKAISVASDYVPLQRGTQGQQRVSKDAQEWIRIAKRYGRNIVGTNVVLAPTKIRRTGRIHVISVPMYISTNFGILVCNTQEEAKLIGSFMTTILYQLECEVQCKDHAGLRKIELQDLKHTHIPNILTLSRNDKRHIIETIDSISILELNNPEVREIDRVWARILYGDEAENVLEKAEILLRFLANRRSPI